MTERTGHPVEPPSLSLSRAEEWTLHGVLSDRRARSGESRRESATHLHAAFETLDGGGRRFTRSQLEAMQGALARAHHTRRWEGERPRVERLLQQVSGALETDPVEGVG
jgi:hypothetical protein